MKKDCYFKIVAGILPIVLILLLEGGLRLVGFGNNLSLFVQDGYLQPIITQYFIDNKSEIWLLFLIAHSKR